MFEGFCVEDEKCVRGVFKEFLAAISEDGWKVWVPAVHILMGDIISNDSGVPSPLRVGSRHDLT